MNRGGTRAVGLANAEDQCCICLGLAAEREDVVAAGGHGTCSPVAFALAINSNQQQSTTIKQIKQTSVLMLRYKGVLKGVSMLD